MSANWIAQTRVPVSAIVSALGWHGRRNHYPCPAKCEGSDPRPVYATNHIWACQRCGAKGDHADFVAYALNGSRLSTLDSNQRNGVREWFGVARPVAAPQTPTTAPDPAALRSFWQRCLPVTDDAQVSEYLRSRAIPPAIVQHLDLARATPNPPIPTPFWPRGRFNTYRLITRGYSSAGLANLHARAVVTPPVLTDKDTGEKVQLAAKLWAKGIPSAGVVMWNRVRPSAAARVIVTEGLTDFLTAATQVPDAAVYGATSGSFAAFRLPHVPIYDATDPDAAGDAYAQTLRRTLPGHALYRLPLPPGVDLNAHVMRGGSVHDLLTAATPMDPA